MGIGRDLARLQKQKHTWLGRPYNDVFASSRPLRSYGSWIFHPPTPRNIESKQDLKLGSSQRSIAPPASVGATSGHKSAITTAAIHAHTHVYEPPQRSVINMNQPVPSFSPSPIERGRRTNAPSICGGCSFHKFPACLILNLSAYVSGVVRSTPSSVFAFFVFTPQLPVTKPPE